MSIVETIGDEEEDEAGRDDDGIVEGKEVGVVESEESSEVEASKVTKVDDSVVKSENSVDASVDRISVVKVSAETKSEAAFDN